MKVLTAIIAYFAVVITAAVLLSSCTTRDNNARVKIVENGTIIPVALTYPEWQAYNIGDSVWINVEERCVDDVDSTAMLGVIESFVQ